jgi:hypothetical protein
MKSSVSRTAQKLVSSAGLSLVSLSSTRGDHHRAVVEAPDGRREFVIFASTSGDVRSNQNLLSHLRRIARGITYKPVHQPKGN